MGIIDFNKFIVIGEWIEIDGTQKWDNLSGDVVSLEKAEEIKKLSLENFNLNAPKTHDWKCKVNIITFEEYQELLKN